MSRTRKRKRAPSSLNSFLIHLKARIISALYDTIRKLQDGATIHIVIGAKWGDEGKGKVCAFFSQHADLAIRATGGANAGHTVVIHIDGKTIKVVLHILPAGVAYPHMQGLIGQGVVVDLEIMFNEIEEFKKYGLDVESNLKISGKAAVLMPYHKELDALYEQMRSNKIGTTKKGIGPAYEDKIKRDGLTIYHLLGTKEELEAAINAAVIRHNILFKEYGMTEQVVDAKTLAEEYHKYGERIRPMVVDGHHFVRKFAEDSAKRIVVEGAQAVMLSIETGDYPDVTSSDSNTNGTLSGAHLSIGDVPEVTLVFKGYDSRVGNGPFPTEMEAHIDDNGNMIEYSELEAYVGDLLRDIAHEYGATTGRPRRVGWFDTVAARYAVEVSGARALCINHIDTIGKFGIQHGGIALCTKYLYHNRVIDYYPADINTSHEIPKPVYDWYEGWEITPDMKSYKDLPKACKRYIEAIEAYVGVPVKYIGIGPGDNDMIVRKF